MTLNKAAVAVAAFLISAMGWALPNAGGKAATGARGIIVSEALLLLMH